MKSQIQANFQDLGLGLAGEGSGSILGSALNAYRCQPEVHFCFRQLHLPLMYNQGLTPSWPSSHPRRNPKW